MNITVLIPTYRRPQDLLRCLDALTKQIRSPDEVLVVARDSDRATWDAIATVETGALPIRTVSVTIPGQVAALNTGIEAAKGDIIAITDDDAAPRPHWLERIAYHFETDDAVGGVGGRDWLYVGGTDRDDGKSAVVGRVQWFGRVIGRHNLGFGEPREVEILKGANMSYRKQAIAIAKFDTRLLGAGAQVHNDLAFSLGVKRRGWKLIYDPAADIDHYQAQRFDEDQRDQFNETAFFNAVHNETIALLDYLPMWRRIVFLIWAFLVGTRKAFGLVQWLRFFPKDGGFASRKLWLSLKGRWEGFQTWRMPPGDRTPQEGAAISVPPS
ncbi:glycosyltransferase family 2 protein [Vacuolonema iberomarrocanum]|uniref:glycosyltransferase family 2 protein n=1 Tax=Vacuolonema iberomarrocanum TaxID=3454632 RepID=UPI001A052AC5|nr:glycosyltransferase family 2 protein [filamentous cyanobacterium LEGE 07170]